jgi:tetratricopeptide (TPR) repeat protein
MNNTTEENYQKAINFLETVIKKNLHNATALFNMGCFYHDHDKARECYQKAVKLKPDFVDAYIHLGGNYWVTHQEKESKECYQKVIDYYTKNIKKYPDFANSYYQIGRIYCKYMDEKEKAREYLQKTVELWSDCAEAYILLGECSVEEKAIDCYQKAIDCYKKELEQFPDSANTHYRIGQIYHIQIHDNEKAREYIQKAIELKPNTVRYHHFLKWCI